MGPTLDPPGLAWQPAPEWCRGCGHRIHRTRRGRLPGPWSPRPSRPRAGTAGSPTGHRHSPPRRPPPGRIPIASPPGRPRRGFSVAGLW